MDKKTTWYPQVIKWQSVYHKSEYTPNGGKDSHQYITLEHEAVIMYCKESGETKLTKHSEELVKD